MLNMLPVIHPLLIVVASSSTFKTSPGLNATRGLSPLGDFIIP